MNNKLLTIIIIIAAVLVGAYFLMPGMTDTAPNLDEADYVGLTTAQAEEKAEIENTPFRVIEIDGEPQPTTRDIRDGRINAVVESGIVTKYTIESGNRNDIETNVDNSISQENDADNMDDDAMQHNEIIGMTEAEAKAYAEANNVDFRVGVRDGEALPVTLDYRPGRITAEVEQGVVVAYTVE
jgi:hypothetical protein